MAAKSRFATLPNSGIEGVFEFSEPVCAVPQFDGKDGPACPCCKKPMKAIFDIMQMGFWDDHFKTYFACKECGRAVEYIYDLSRLELPPGDKKSSRRARVNRILGR